MRTTIGFAPWPAHQTEKTIVSGSDDKIIKVWDAGGFVSFSIFPNSDFLNLNFLVLRSHAAVKGGEKQRAQHKHLLCGLFP